MANELDVGSIVLRIRANAEGLKEGMDQLDRALGQAATATQQAGASIDKSTRGMSDSVNKSSAAQAAAYAAIAAAAAKAMAAVVGAISAGIEAINKYQAAIIGLDSVASGKGVGSQAMTDALDQVTDAFFSAADASTAFKNLLARGYDLDQATNAILRLKDAAAFGRQASYGLAEAVVTATEGLKNENSILVDNAGVTKNVAKMWEDYAKSLGVATTALTQQQKIEAEVKGIMEETRYQVGDLAKLQDTLAGSQASAAMSAEKLAEAYGRSMSPAVEGLTRLWDAFLKGLTDIVNQFPGLIAGVSAAALAIGAFVVAQKAAAALQALNLALQAAAGGATIFGIAINTALPWLGALAALVGLVTMAWTNHARAEELAREQAEEQLRVEKERQGALQATASDLQKLGDRYNELSGKTNRTYAESEEMLRIEAQLKDQYGITGSSLRDLAGDYNTVTEAIRQKRAESLKELQESKDLATAAAKATYDDAQAKELAAREYVALGKRLEQAKADLQDLWADDKTGSNYNTFLANAGKDLWNLIGDLEKAQRETVYKHGLQVDALEQYADQAKVAAGDLARAYIDSATNAFEISGGKLDQGVKTMLDRLFISLAEAPTKLQHTNVDAMVDAYTQALSNADVGPAVRAMEEVNRKIVLGMEPKDSDLTAIEKGWQAVLDFARNVGESLGLDDNQIMAFATQLAPVMANTAAGLDNVTAASQQLFDLWKNQHLADFMAKEGQDLADAINETNKAVQGQVQVMDSLAQQYKGETDVISGLNKLIEGFETGNDKLVKAAKDALVGLGYDAPESLELARQALDRRLSIQQAYQSDMGILYADMEAMRQRYKDQMTALEGEGRQDSAEYKSIKAFVAMIEEAQYRAGIAMRHGGLTGIGDDEAQKIDATTAAISDLQAELDRLRKNAEGNAEAIAQMQERIAALKIVREGMASGQTETQQYQDALAYLQQLPEFANLALGGLDAVNSALGIQQAIMAASTAMLSGDMAQMQTLMDGLQERLASLAEGSDEYVQVNGLINALKQAMTIYQNMTALPTTLPWADAFDMTTASAEKLQEELDRLTAAANTAGAELEKKRNLSATYREINKVAEAQIAGKASAEDWAKAQADFAEVMGYSAQSAQEMSTATNVALSEVDSSIATHESQMQGLAGSLQNLVRFINTSRPEFGIDTGPAVAALNGLIAIWNVVRALMGLPPIGGASATKTGGGGGGGKSAFAKDLDAIAHDVAMGRIQLEGELKRLEALDAKYRDRRGRSTLKQDDREDLDERLYQKREELRKQNLQADYDAMEHKKALDQLSIQQEISALERIQQAHKLNADEQREMAEQLHDARNRLRERELNWALALVDHQTAMSELNAAAQIQALERIKGAHQLTQEEMWRLEERIHSLRQQQAQDQVSQVRSVYDQITAALRKRYEAEKQLETKALDDRIKHLNDLTDAENRQAREDDHQTNLAEKQRLLSVTKSARQRRELQAEIDKLIADEELRRRQEARQDEIDGLNEQKQAINEKYQQLMDEENLRQEALRVVMSGNLQQMTDLISSYGTKWKDAGEQLAKALTEGLTGNSSGIMRQINALLEGQQTAVNRYLQQMGGLPNLTGSSGITLNLYGLTVRKEADVELVAGVIFDKIRASGR